MFHLMKKNHRLVVSGLALLLALLMLPAAAFAQTNWPEFQQNESNTGVITDGAPTGSSPTVTEQSLGSGYINAASVLNYESGTTYAYTLAPTTSGATVFKTNVASPSSAVSGWPVTLNDSDSFQLSTPVINGSTLYAAGLAGFERLSDYTFSQSTAGPWTVTPSGSTVSYDQTSPSGCGIYTTCADIDTSGTSSTTTLVQETNSQVNSADSINICLGAYGPSSITGVTAVISAAPVTNGNVGTYTQIWSTASSSQGWTTSGSTGGTWTSGQWNWVNWSVTGSPFTTTGYYSIEYVITVTGTGNLDITNSDLMCYEVGVSAVTNITGTPSVTALAGFPAATGQINTPLVYDNGYVYGGSWANGTKTGSYYQINASTGAASTFTPSTTDDGFYWAGVTVVTDTSGNRYQIFGGDKGILYVMSPSSWTATPPTADHTYTVSGSGKTAGKIRSSICYDSADNLIFFTDENGYLWCYTVTRGSSDVTLAFKWVKSIGYTTSTPAFLNSRLYVGYGSVGGSGAVYCFSNLTSSAPTQEWEDSSVAGPVQSSPIVYNNGSNTYVYFTTNNSTGTGYCIEDNMSTGYSAVWTATSSTYTPNYCLQGMSSENKYLVFGNDGGYLTVVN